jgi:hypothetical protein
VLPVRLSAAGETSCWTSAFIPDDLNNFGFIEIPWPKEWQGTKLHVNSGTVAIKGAVLPGTIGDYVMDCARRASERFNAMSSRQRQIVCATQEKDLDRVAESEYFHTMCRDVTLFGRAAFGPEEGQD